MTQLQIKGHHPLTGNVTLSGDQQTILAIQAASILSTQGTVIVDHVPATTNILQMNQLLKSLNLVVNYQPQTQLLKMDATHHIEPVQVSGQYLIAAGAILGRCRRVRLVDNGINQDYQEKITQLTHFFRKLGASTRVFNHRHIVDVQADFLTGTQIDVSDAQVDVLLTVMMVATLAQNITVLHHPINHPAVTELAKVLNRMGARVHGAGTDTIRIQGVTFLHSTDYWALDDQEEAGLFLTLGALTAGDLVVQGARREHLQQLINYLIQMGNTVIIQRHGIRVIGTSLQLPVNISPQLYENSGDYLRMGILALAMYAHGDVCIKNVTATQWTLINSVVDTLDNHMEYHQQKLVIHAPMIPFKQITVTSPVGGILAICCGLAANDSVQISPAELASGGFTHLIDQLVKLGAQIDLNFN